MQGFSHGKIFQQYSGNNDMNPAASGHSDVVIVGAGITGISTALNLAEQGASVTVVDRYQPAAMASGWTLGGVRQSGRDPAELALAKRAVSLWQSLDEQLGASTGYRQSGNLRLARDEAEAKIIRALVTQQRDAGLNIELLDADTLQAQAPALSPALVCASLCSSDGQANPMATSSAYRSAAERLGVRFQTQTAVQGVNIHAGQFNSLETSAGTVYADRCILATGVQTNDLLQPLGLRLPIQWAVVSVMQSEPLPQLMSEVIGVANANLALRQQADGCLRMTSGADFTNTTLAEENGLPQVETIPAIINATMERIKNVLPAAGNITIVRHWGGLLDMTPDGLPVIDRLPDIEGVFVAAGFSGHGFGIGPAVGESVAQLALQDRSDLPLTAFAFKRFEAGSHASPELHG